jgi:hypothetical protein
VEASRAAELEDAEAEVEYDLIPSPDGPSPICSFLEFSFHSTEGPAATEEEEVGKELSASRPRSCLSTPSLLASASVADGPAADAVRAERETDSVSSFPPMFINSVFLALTVGADGELDTLGRRRGGDKDDWV